MVIPLKIKVIYSYYKKCNVYTIFKEYLAEKEIDLFFLFFFSGRIQRLFRGFPGGSVVKICLPM